MPICDKLSIARGLRLQRAGEVDFCQPCACALLNALRERMLE